MATWSLGSAANAIQNMVPNIPVSISGGQLMDIVDRSRLRIEDYTGQSVGSTAIAEKYQPCLINFSIAELLPLIHLQGGGMSMAGMSTGNSAMDAAATFEARGMVELRRLGMKSTVYKVYG